MTDEKLAECSAQATGVYIRIMCLMHKSEEYGKIALSGKDITIFGQNSPLEMFAQKLVRHLPYSVETIQSSLRELVDEKVLYIEGTKLCQKRMIKDSYISNVRSESGKSGAKKKYNKEFAMAKHIAKPLANEVPEEPIPPKKPRKPKESKEKKFDFRESLISIGVEPNIADDWIKVRKTKRATNTETAFEQIRKEIDKSGLTPNECIKLAAAKSWQGFNAEWITSKSNSNGSSKNKPDNLEPKQGVQRDYEETF